MKIATYNIRFNNVDDGKNQWKYRKEHVKQLIRYHQWDIFGMQEVLSDQLEDILQLNEYDYVGVGRDDGKMKGEYSPIFYRKEMFELLEENTFWLSETPNVPSKSWNANCTRVCTYGRFKVKENGKEFVLINTHLDDFSEEARINGCILIKNLLEEKFKGFNIILTGDFNGTDKEEGYKIITSVLNDSKDVSEMDPYGPNGTFQDFNYNVDLENIDRIDYIFVSRNIDILKYGVLTDNCNNKYPSDHFPIEIIM